MTFQPGVIVAERFEIITLLGKGGYGEVYQARQLSMQRMVALKVLRARLIRNTRAVKRFENEARFACRLSDPHTVVYHDFGFDESHGVLFLAMEFLKGETLQSRIKRDGPLTLEQTTALLEQICQSLEEAHELGLVHRDIKPDNLMLIRRAGRLNFVKVIDFGIAKATARFEEGPSGPLTMTGAVLGTPHYMAPEQIQGGVALDPRTDVYALACLSYRMLTGLPPFRGKSAIEIATQHLRVRPPPLTALTRAALPSSLSDYLLQALSKDMATRPTSAWDFYDGWCAALGADTQTAPRMMDFDSLSGGETQPAQVLSAQRASAAQVRSPDEDKPGQAGLTSTSGLATARTGYNARQRRHLTMGLLMLLAGVIFMGAMATLIGKKWLRQRETPSLALTTSQDSAAQTAEHDQNQDDDERRAASATSQRDTAATTSDDEREAVELDVDRPARESPDHDERDQQPEGDAPDDRREARAQRSGSSHKRPNATKGDERVKVHAKLSAKQRTLPDDAAHTGEASQQTPSATTLQSVRLVVKPWGSVSVNGQTRPSPATFKLKPGRYQATFSARGQTPVKRIITVGGKSMVVIHDFNR